MTQEPKQIPEHESPVRHILHAAGKIKFQPLKSLQEAQQTPNGIVVLEGDWGGTIFATCQCKYITASQEEIVALCKELEKTFWDCNTSVTDEGGWGVHYEVKAPGSGVSGGMGGGLVVDGLWAHPDLGEELHQKIKLALKLRQPGE